jgi:uncharacterized protein (TIGR02145 family)
MKKVMINIGAILIASLILTSFSLNSYAQSAPIREVKIGRQIWMAENLNVDKFRNGDPIPHSKTPEEWKKANNNKQPAWCYYDHNPANGEKYGKLYNGYAVNDPRGLAPEGWLIPDGMEWNKLIEFLQREDRYTNCSEKLKSSSGWKDDYNGTNESGFSGLPGGFCDTNGAFHLIGQYGRWMSYTDEEKIRQYERSERERANDKQERADMKNIPNDLEREKPNIKEVWGSLVLWFIDNEKLKVEAINEVGGSVRCLKVKIKVNLD